MKLTPDFFHEKETRLFLDRAAAALSVPVSVHGPNDWHITGRGGCAACTWVNKQLKGKQACRASREEYLEMVLRGNVPVTFVCHMGFTCVSAAVIPEDNYTVTLGPYVPDTDTSKTGLAIERGLAALNKTDINRLDPPFTLEDMRTLPQGSVRAATEWILDGLRELFKDFYSNTPEDADEVSGSPTATATPAPKHSQGRHRHRDNPVEVSIMALSLLCGRTQECRTFLLDFLEENKRYPEQLKPGIIRMVSQLVEAVKRQGGDIHAVWSTYTAFVESVNTLNNDESLIAAADKVLRRAARTCSSGFKHKYPYLPKAIIALHVSYHEKKLLTTTAETCDVALSTITRTLEQLTGANFSEVRGRIRILHASRLLRTSTLPASSIAKLVGINDQANFAKLFKRYRGDTPGAYRAYYRK